MGKNTTFATQPKTIKQMKKLIFATLMTGLLFGANAQQANKSNLNNLKQHKLTTAAILKKAQTKPGKMVSSMWDADQWRVVDTTYFEYNTNGKITKETRIDHDGNINLVINTYFGSGKTQSSVFLNKSNIGTTFDTTYKTIYTLDAKGNIETTSTIFYMSGQPFSDYTTKYVTTYGANDRVENFISQTWDSDKNEFVNEIKFEGTYATDGSPNTLNISSYDTITNTFVPEERLINLTWQVWEGNLIDIVTEESGALIKGYTTEEYDGSTWSVAGRSNLTYDNKNNLLTTLDESFDGTSYDTSYFENNILTYNANNELVERIYQSWDEDTRTISNERKEVYSNFAVVSSINNQAAKNNALTVYPNPATEQVTFTTYSMQNATVIITDLSGKVIASQIMDNGQATINKNQISNGIYIYQVISNGLLTHTGKVVFN